MNGSTQSADTTRQFARVLGPFFAILSTTVTARYADMRELLTQFAASSVWPWVTGAFVLLVGITVVALHPYWRGVAAAMVSVLGWIMVVRGVLLLAVPDVFMSIANRTVGAETLWRVIFVGFILVGLYLTYAGWFTRQVKAGAPASGSIADVPRAA